MQEAVASLPIALPCRLEERRVWEVVGRTRPVKSRRAMLHLVGSRSSGMKRTGWSAPHLDRRMQSLVVQRRVGDVIRAPGSWSEVQMTADDAQAHMRSCEGRLMLGAALMPAQAQQPGEDLGSRMIAVCSASWTTVVVHIVHTAGAHLVVAAAVAYRHTLLHMPVLCPLHRRQVVVSFLDKR